MQLPFQQNQAQNLGPAPAPANPFDAMAGAKLFESGLPQLENGEYLVEINKFESKYPNIFTEFTVWEQLTGTSPVGTKSSSGRNMAIQGWENYFTRDLLAVVGVGVGDPSAEVAKRYLPAMLQAELTRAPQPGPDGKPIAPGTMVGRIVHLAVSENIDPATGQRRLSKKGKYFPNLSWRPSEKQK